MKRSTPSLNPSYIIKNIPNSDKSHSRDESQNKERTPSDVGNTYITVPVYRKGEKFTKKQIKDASTMYTICGTSSHSFVLSLKSDPSVHIAIPYYRTCETNINGKPCVSVSNFFPVSTLQATPPPGISVVGQTAQLSNVDSNSLQSIFVYPETEKRLQSSTPTLQSGPYKPIAQSPSGKKQPITNSSSLYNMKPSLTSISSDSVKSSNYLTTSNQYQYQNNSTFMSNSSSIPLQRQLSMQSSFSTPQDNYTILPKPSQSMNPSLLRSSSSSLSDMSSKKPRLTQDIQSNPQSYWNGDSFICIHSIPHQDKQELINSFSRARVEDAPLLTQLFKYISHTGYLKVEDISKVFPGDESKIIKYANLLSTLHVFQFMVPASQLPAEGVYTLFGVKNVNGLEFGNSFSLVSEVDEMKKEIDRIKQRIDILERDNAPPEVILNTIRQKDPTIVDNPLYKQIMNLPFFYDTI